MISKRKTPKHSLGKKHVLGLLSQEPFCVEGGAVHPRSERSGAGPFAFHVDNQSLLEDLGGPMVTVTGQPPDHMTPWGLI